jgi:hypothetical protein
MITALKLPMLGPTLCVRTPAWTLCITSGAQDRSLVASPLTTHYVPIALTTFCLGTRVKMNVPSRFL